MRIVKGLTALVCNHKCDTHNNQRWLSVALVLAMLTTLCSCSGASMDNSNPAPNPPTILQERHTSFYPKVAQPVSYGDVTSLSYQVSNKTLFYGEQSLQKVEFWPAAQTSNATLPAIIFIHGGCWSNSFRINQSYPIATALALNGFPVWSVEYRATGDQGGGWPGTFDDVKEAIHFISTVANGYYSPRKTIVVGHSAGGHLALLARTQMSLDFDVIGLAAITDLITYANEGGSCNSLAASFMNGRPSANPEQYALANPDLDGLSDRAYLFSGELDNIVKISQASFSGVPYQVVAQTGHFDWIHPGTNSFSALLRYLNEQ